MRFKVKVTLEDGETVTVYETDDSKAAVKYALMLKGNPNVAKVGIKDAIADRAMREADKIASIGVSFLK